MGQNVSRVIVMGRKGDDPHSANKDMLADEVDNDIYSWRRNDDSFVPDMESEDNDPYANDVENEITNRDDNVPEEPMDDTEMAIDSNTEDSQHKQKNMTEFLIVSNLSHLEEIFLKEKLIYQC